ncbi:MAG: AbrB/MazE/SpoVT family DNA-binding domain-containing protein [Actinomycetes bacterium]
MTEITVRQRNQVTIPKAIADAAGISEGTVCDLQFANGVITIRLADHRQPGDSIMRFAGIGKGLWGSTPEEIDRTIAEDHASWERDLYA